MGSIWARVSIPGLAATAAVGLVLSPLLIGFEPVGADPDLLYRPIKAELARALRAGTLPFWSERFGLGVPILAESHAAALYPPNLVLYRCFDVSTAYRLAMWGHFALLALTTYLYARRLKLTPWGAALAAVSFTFCGFQAIHAGHEPFYCATPYLPLVLLLVDHYAVSGRLWRLAWVAAAWGAQLTLGHFQIQFWTGGLALLLGTWRILAERRPWPRLLGLWLGLGWGVAIAAAQLGPTWELTRTVGYGRPFDQLTTYAFPPAHWAQPAVPSMFFSFGSDAGAGTAAAYWGAYRSSIGESGFYIGTAALILAFVGFIGDGAERSRSLRPWRFVVVASLTLATLPLWWADGYRVVSLIPGFGWFRSPGRYTLLTALGLCLLAGHGLDRSIRPRRFRTGLILALFFGAGAFGWTLFLWSQRPDYRQWLGDHTLVYRLGAAGLVWGLSLLALLVWRWAGAKPGSNGTSERFPAAAIPVLAAWIELSALFYLSHTRWDWSAPFPSESPVAQRLVREPGVGLVANPAGDLLVRAGLTTAYPSLGITPPPPNYLLEPAGTSLERLDPAAARWMRRFGVTHSVRQTSLGRNQNQSQDRAEAEVIFEGADPTLDRILYDAASRPQPSVWQIRREPGAFPPAWAATKAVVAADWYELYPKLSADDAPDEAWYTAEDVPPSQPQPRAQTARVVAWDGRQAVVEHDGVCDLVVRRPSYPGWVARINDGPEQPVGRACGGLQAVRLFGRGPSRVAFRYEPTTWRTAGRVSLAALSLAAVVAAGGFRGMREKNKPQMKGMNTDGKR